MRTNTGWRLMDQNLIIGIGSITIGLIAGILTLWKTSGAKREKIKSSYRDIIAILIRSITQSQIKLRAARFSGFQKSSSLCCPDFPDLRD